MSLSLFVYFSVMVLKTDCVERKTVTHLALDQHRHVHEHVVQLFDAILQLHDVLVPSLDIS